MRPGTFMMSSCRRAAFSRLICSSRHEHLAALVPALLCARLLVLDVVAWDPDLDEAANQIPDVRVAAVAGVGVGDNEWPIVDLGCGIPLRLAQAQAAKRWFWSAVSRARTIGAASSGTWESG